LGCGKPEQEIVGANKLLAVTSSVPTVSEAFWGETQNAFSDPSYNTRKGAFGPRRKKGGASPPPTLNFACSLLFSSNNVEFAITQWIEIFVIRHLLG
jgi:hypothetical protein